MAINAVYLQSLHLYNFRHGQENPKIIGFENVTPAGLHPRPCFKVEYESDGFTDYIAHEEVIAGHWAFIGGPVGTVLI